MDTLESLIEYAHLLYEKGYVAGSSGNLSLRADDGIYITPTHRRLNKLSEEDIVFVKDINSVSTDRASIELAMHETIYNIRRDINAIIHAHPPYTTAISFYIPRDYTPFLPETETLLGKIGIVSFLKPGSLELANAVGEAVKDAEVIILKKHGIVTIGYSIEECFNKLEIVEFDARVRSIKKILRNL